MNRYPYTEADLLLQQQELEIQEQESDHDKLMKAFRRLNLKLDQLKEQIKQRKSKN